MLTSLLSAKLAVATVAAAVTVGGAAAAAYTGNLPAAVQNIAHDTIGAPKTPGTHPAAQHTAPPTRNAMPGQAAYGLCTAYAHLKAHGSAAQKATAFRRLAAAAGGAAQVKTYCAGVAHPAGQSSGTPAGQPSTLPTSAQHTHPAGKPTSPPSHAPATHPAGRPTSTP